MRKTSDLLNEIKSIESDLDGKVSVENILNKNNENAYFLLILTTIFSFLPFIFALFCGAINVYISVQIILRKKVILLPKMIRNLSIKKQTLTNIIDKILPTILKLESKTKNRLLFFFVKKYLNLLRIFMLIISIVIMIPIPLSGTIPAISLLLLLFGILNKDGLIVLIGLIIGVIGIFITTLIVFLGRAILRLLI